MSIEMSILRFIAAHPGSRQRYIAKAVKLWQCHVDFLSAMQDLHAMELIRNVSISDPANMEYYYEWYITEKGKEIIRKDNENNDAV